MTMIDQWASESTNTSMTESPSTSPLLSVRVVVENNEEEVWSIDSYEPSPFPQTQFQQSYDHFFVPTVNSEGNTPPMDHRKKRRIDAAESTAASYPLFHALSESYSSLQDSNGETAENSLEDDEEMMDSVWSVLRPYKYVDIRRDRRSQLRIMKVPKNDLRREYLTMFCSAVNTHDPILLRSFFRQYCDPAVSFHRVCLDGTCVVRSGASAAIKREGISETNADCQVRRYGQPDAFALWAVKFDLNPDHCCSVRDVKVITTRKSNAVRLEADLIIRRTEIYDVSAEKLRYLWLQKVLSTYYAGESCDEYTAELRSADQPDDTILQDQGLYPLPLTSDPRLFTVTGRFVVNINAERRIESILFHPMLIESDPVTV